MGVVCADATGAMGSYEGRAFKSGLATRIAPRPKPATKLSTPKDTIVRDSNGVFELIAGAAAAAFPAKISCSRGSAFFSLGPKFLPTGSTPLEMNGGELSTIALLFCVLVLAP